MLQYVRLIKAAWLVGMTQNDLISWLSFMFKTSPSHDDFVLVAKLYSQFEFACKVSGQAYGKYSLLNKFLDKRKQNNAK